jgi:hypothetical protein
MPLDITWNNTIRTRTRLLAGVSVDEFDVDTVDTTLDIAAEWFQSNTDLTYTLNENDNYDNAVMYYACYLLCMVQNGIGIERIQIGDASVYYDNTDYIHFKELAEQQLVMKMGLSIKTTTYNANPWTGQVNWKKNVDGVDSTKTMYPRPRGVNYD